MYSKLNNKKQVGGSFIPYIRIDGGTIICYKSERFKEKISFRDLKRIVLVTNYEELGNKFFWVLKDANNKILAIPDGIAGMDKLLELFMKLKNYDEYAISEARKTKKNREFLFWEKVL